MSLRRLACVVDFNKSQKKKSVMKKINKAQWPTMCPHAIIANDRNELTKSAARYELYERLPEHKDFGQ